MLVLPFILSTFVDQTKKTKIIDSCLDPVWNEEFTFTLIEPLEELRLVNRATIDY